MKIGRTRTGNSDSPGTRVSEEDLARPGGGALLSGGSRVARSIGALQLRHRTIAAAQKGHQRFDTLAALSTAATCGVDAARLGGAGGRSGLFYLVVGQRIAKANIHHCRVPAMAGTPTAYRLVAYFSAGSCDLFATLLPGILRMITPCCARQRLVATVVGKLRAVGAHRRDQRGNWAPPPKAAEKPSNNSPRRDNRDYRA